MKVPARGWRQAQEAKAHLGQFNRVREREGESGSNQVMLAQTTLGQIAGECVWESSAGQREREGGAAKSGQTCPGMQSI